MPYLSLDTLILVGRVRNGRTRPTCSTVAMSKAGYDLLEELSVRVFSSSLVAVLRFQLAGRLRGCYALCCRVGWIYTVLRDDE